jgi:hypothetical protein
VLVLRAEGTADTASRTNVDTTCARGSRRTSTGKVDAGDITLTEAGAMVGCEPSETACKTRCSTRSASTSSSRTTVDRDADRL